MQTTQEYFAVYRGFKKFVDEYEPSSPFYMSIWTLYDYEFSLIDVLRLGRSLNASFGSFSGFGSNY